VLFFSPDSLLSSRPFVFLAELTTAGGAEKRHAAATCDGAAILMGCSASEGRCVLSPLISFYQEQRNRSPHIQVLCNQLHFVFCLFGLIPHTT
jgi:hypothetical protein